MPDYKITSQAEGDKAFICDSWRRSQQDAPACAKMPTRAYVAWMQSIIRGFVGDHNSEFELAPGVFVLVARDKDRPKYIYGWALFCQSRDKLSLVYTFVKKDHQKQGVAKALLVEAMEQSGEPLVHYAARTRFDEIWESMGLTYLPVQHLEVAA